MKKKKIEGISPLKTKKNGWITTVQKSDNILILNVYSNRILQGRHCINVETDEFEQWNEKEQRWYHRKLTNLLGFAGNCYYTQGARKRLKMNSKEEEELVFEMIPKDYGNSTVFDVVNRMEERFDRNKRSAAEDRRWARVNALMNQVQDLPDGVEDWIYQRASGNADYAFYNKDTKKWSCTACGKSYDEKYLHRVDREKKIRHNDMVICPRCKKVIQVKRRTDRVDMTTHFMILQPLGEEHSVARHFYAEIHWREAKRQVYLNEEVRVVLNKLSYKPKLACDIYYRQWGCFDNKSNPGSKRTYAGYLYEDNVEECLQDTCYEKWARLFKQMAAVGEKAQYNRLMATQYDENFIGMIECLFKGRFHRLLLETTEKISYWSCEYYGSLRKNENTIEGVFQIQDRQKINRIRELDGGYNILEWMRWSDKKGKKIPQDALEWLLANNFEPDDLKFMLGRMNPQQIMNYIMRQQLEGYKGMSAQRVIEQWKDYLTMCVKLKKKTIDEMVYRPRELKRRHDEAVAEIALRDAEIQADEYSARFPGAEDVLKEIKPKFEYSNDEYIMIVPERLVEIIAEGRALHHCAGATDRYFDRIKQRETYICFLRKAEEPKNPYYTIEVEPGGTIRQHRGYLDEEPEIEKVKPFLREWQQVIKKRLNEKDRKYAAISAIKREQNIEELKQNNNTRVLNGLMEDFMEAI